jgi:hypothetical protein
VKIVRIISKSEFYGYMEELMISVCQTSIHRITNMTWIINPGVGIDYLMCLAHDAIVKYSDTSRTSWYRRKLIGINYLYMDSESDMVLAKSKGFGVTP